MKEFGQRVEEVEAVKSAAKALRRTAEDVFGENYAHTYYKPSDVRNAIAAEMTQMRQAFLDTVRETGPLLNDEPADQSRKEASMRFHHRVTGKAIPATDRHKVLAKV